MAKLVTLKIDGTQLAVSAGTLIVNAARQLGINIPVFCYHPKLEPVGMCRMCLVEVGRPVLDRATSQPVLEADGSPRIQFGPKLETACTTPVSEGMVVLTTTAKAKAARHDIVEFLLTSHPLDCPVCDKGGECPLQNLTLAHGSATSRFLYDEKKHLKKHVPLGELIFLDRERCIQCGRCVRFQCELVDDPVIGFAQRGRSMEIITNSEPGFDSIWSGNTTDICPVGALTTADFRFGARPWEMKSKASICTLCPVGCNITFNVRREAKAGGDVVIKRVMPRQNEAVNEIWICDKGRFGYHYTEDSARLSQPLVRKGDELLPATWEEALDLAGNKIRGLAGGMVSLVGGNLSNEDLFNIHQLTKSKCGEMLQYSSMAGGDLVGQFGLGHGSNLGDLGKGSVILVVASDLHEEAPLWWLRIKAAARRGATLIVMNARATRLDKFASFAIRYVYGEEDDTLSAFLPKNSDSIPAHLKDAVKALSESENAMVFFGSDGLGLHGSTNIARLCAEILIQTDHVNRVNNGLIAVWPNGNSQGAWDLDFHPTEDLQEKLSQAGLVYVVAADPAGDDPVLAAALDNAGFVIVQELTLTETARHADIVFPAQAFTEREGTYTSGERRLQRFYPAVPPKLGTRADFTITAELASRLSVLLETESAAVILSQIEKVNPDYAGITYPMLSQVQPQTPVMSRSDLYYGGTSYENSQGLGIQIAPRGHHGEKVNLPKAGSLRLPKAKTGELVVVPITRLYDQGSALKNAILLVSRLAEPELIIHPAMAERLHLKAREMVDVSLHDGNYPVMVRLDETIPDSVGLIPRKTGIPISGPVTIKISEQKIQQSGR